MHNCVYSLVIYIIVTRRRVLHPFYSQTNKETFCLYIYTLVLLVFHISLVLDPQ